LIQRLLPKILIFFLVTILFSVVFFSPHFVLADEVDQINDQIDEKESEKDAKQKALEASEKAELEAQLNKLPLADQLALVEKTLAEKNAELSKLEKTLSEKEAEIKKRETDLKVIAEIRDSQLLSVYIASRTRTLSVFFSGKTPVQIVRDLIFRNVSVKALVANLREVQVQYDQLARDKEDLAVQKLQLAETKKSLEKQKSDLEAQIAEIQAKINSQKSTQASLRNEVLALDKEISSLSAEAQKKIASKSGSQSGSGGGTPGNGSGTAPVEGAPGTYDIYKNNVLVKAGASGPIELRPETGVRFVVGSKSYRGDLIFRQDTNVYFINRLAVQDYLKGIGEMPSSWQAEALKSQVIAARTYAYANWNKRLTYKYNLLDNTNDQNYVGYGKETAASGGNWVSAVNATSSKVIKKNGALITAWYHSSCGGHTISSAEKWGGSRVYAVGNSDRYMSGGLVHSYDEASPYYQKRWGTSSLSNAVLIDLLNAAIYLQKNNASVTAQNKLISGQPGYLNPPSLQSTLGADSLQSKLGGLSSSAVTYDSGGATLNLNSKHTASIVANGPNGALTLDDAYFELAYNLRSPGTNYIASSLWFIRAEGGAWNVYSMGYGHRVGMCQYGAQGRAQAGQTYATIISAYYNGSQVVDQNSPASTISIGITQTGGSQTTLTRDGNFGLYANNSKIATGLAGETWKIVRK
jgi:SpoIID/LytB domain protein